MFKRLILFVLLAWLCAVPNDAFAGVPGNFETHVCCNEAGGTTWISKDRNFICYHGDTGHFVSCMADWALFD